jgi:hypothetical protein
VYRRDYRGFNDFKDRVFRDAHAPWPGFTQSRTGLQQFSGIAAHDSSRFHAGNSYVENQNNYYTPTTPTSQALNNESQDVLALLSALEFPEMNLRRVIIEKEFPGTCTWLKNTDEYKRWRERRRDDSHCMLWIKGIPGAGKSTIMRYAYSEEMASSFYMPIAFFFNAKGNDLAKSAEGMFRTLLYQLVRKTSHDLGLPDMVTRSEQEYFRKHGWPLALLKNLFRQALLFRANENLQHVVSYIDALDECPEDEVRELLAYFEELANGIYSFSTPKMCFSSRPYPNITIDHCETILLERRPEHKDDIRKYALSRLRVGHLEDSESNYYRGLISDIVETSAGVFLWVVLVVAQLRKSADQGVNPRLLGEHLLATPPALHDLFDTMIDQDETSVHLLPIVQWVLFAQGRLRAIDLYFAVSFSTGSLRRVEAYSDWKSFDERWLRNFILTSSKGFLRVTDTKPSSYMPCEFIHDSVREYFLDSGLRKLDPSLGSDVVTESHARLAQTCQDYLNSPISEQQLEWADLQPMSPVASFDALDLAPLLAYIRDKGAFLHAEIADRNRVAQTGFCLNFDFDAWLHLVQFPRYSARGRFSDQIERAMTMRSNYTALHVLVDNQLESLVQRKLQIHATADEQTLDEYINARCGSLGTALHLAVERNNITIIRALISGGADVDSHCENLGTPLNYAMLLERAESVEVLLQLGATTTSEQSPHQRRKVLNVRGGRAHGSERNTAIMGLFEHRRVL